MTQVPETVPLNEAAERFCGLIFPGSASASAALSDRIIQILSGAPGGLLADAWKAAPLAAELAECRRNIEVIRL